MSMATRHSPSLFDSSTAPRSSALARDSKPGFERLPPVVREAVAEALIARGLLKTLANLNATSKGVHRDTLPLLWRTVIWNPPAKTEEETEKYWNRVMVLSPGAQFLVDRKTDVPNTTKELPAFIKTAKAYKAGTLKGYIARFDDIKKQRIKNEFHASKVITHLLPSYQPLSEDVITLRHILYMIFEGKTPAAVYYLFLVHSPKQQRRRPLPVSIDDVQVFPAMPFCLDSVLIIPQQKNFVDTDCAQLRGIIFDFFAIIYHRPDPRWNGYLGRFGSQPIMEEQNSTTAYLDFTWQESLESAMICATSTADALKPLRGSARPWFQLSYEIEMVFPKDNVAMHQILRTLRPLYLERAASRLHPPVTENCGDVPVQDSSRDVLASMKRVVPRRRPREVRNMVEYFIKRYPPGKGSATGEDFNDSHDEHVVFYEECPV